MKLPNEKFVEELNDTKSTEFKHMQKTYCDAVSVYSPLSAFLLVNKKVIYIAF